MLANYGYKDASGDFFVTIDTDKCNSCGDCVPACPADVFVVLDEDPNDPVHHSQEIDKLQPSSISCQEFLFETRCSDYPVFMFCYSFPAKKPFTLQTDCNCLTV